MRHRNSLRKLNRTSSHRKALRRNLAQSLFEHGAVRTTLAKAKDLRPFAERLITLARQAKRGSLTSRRRIHALLTDRSMIAAEHREAYDDLSLAKRRQVLASRNGRRYRTGAAKGRLKFTAETVIRHLIDEVAPRFEDRPGGYTRVIRLPKRRVGDQGLLAIVQLVGEEKSPGSIAKPKKTVRRQKADARYAAAVKATKASARGSRGDAKSKAVEPPPEADVTEASSQEQAPEE